jgi:ribosome-associated protein
VTESIRISGGISLPLSEIDIRASRSSGPGGQHSNVTESRIVASFDVRASGTLDDELKARIMGKLGPVVTAVAQDARSQSRNRDLALERLAQRISNALHVPRPRTQTRPTKSSKRKRLDAKRRRGDTKRGRRRVDDSD